jgi:hypothetical protein
MFRHFTLCFCGFPFVEIKDVSVSLMLWGTWFLLGSAHFGQINNFVGCTTNHRIFHAHHMPTKKGPIAKISKTNHQSMWELVGTRWPYSISLKRVGITPLHLNYMTPAYVVESIYFHSSWWTWLMLAGLVCSNSVHLDGNLLMLFIWG